MKNRYQIKCINVDDLDLNRHVEPRIRPLVERMNASGEIQTIASCQGHPAVAVSPYVYFRATIEVASAIEKLLRQSNMRGEQRLSTLWMVDGQFNGEYDLVFTLHSPQWDRQVKSVWSVLPFFGTRMYADLLALADIVEEAVLSHVMTRHRR